MSRTSTTMVVLALVGATALAACGKANNGSSNAAVKGYAGIPAQAKSKTSGGTITFGMAAGATPTYIFPITPGADLSVYTAGFFQSLMYRPLWWSPSGDQLAYNYPESIGNQPVFSNGNKTITINLKSNYKWSNGESVDAQDLIFYTHLLEGAVQLSPANFGDYTPGLFPDNVASITAPSKDQVAITLTKAYNPSYTLYDQLGVLTPMPLAWDVTSFGKAADSGGCLTDSAADKWAKCKAVYTYLNKQALSLSTYASNPLWHVVDGPFTLSAFNPSTDANTMVPNTAYTGPDKPTVSKFEEVAYTSDSAEFSALQSGQLDVGLIPSDDYPQVPKLKTSGYAVFGYPDFGWDYMVFNFKDTTNDWNNIIGQLYVRQALAHLVDSAGYIKSVDHGYAVPATGPVPPEPASPYTPSNATSLYGFNVSQAKSILAAHGWKVVNGVQTCQSSKCGTGIPTGTQLKIQLVYNSGSPAITAEDTAFASDAKSAGIPVSLIGKTFTFMISNYDDPAAPSNVSKWEMEDFGGFSEATYPTTEEIFNTTGSFNIGGYHSTKADSLINDSINASNPTAVKNEAAYIAENLPALFQPEADHVYAWKTSMSGPQASFWELTQFSINPEQWYFTK
ncbi:MAG TPA: ABC transporter substrate-binding protein [Streptosporangiaceae bacterium]|jgi:peptide/nickel transport system substrate-binding protein